MITEVLVCCYNSCTTTTW